VHLQVGDLDRADGFYRDLLGFDIASRYPGASFFGSGGYHHHLAGNIWNSRNAGPRPTGTTGLAQVEVIARDPALSAAILARAEALGVADNTSPAGATLVDPWGTSILLV
jgi:catechol 2,3-dioxygenase